MTTDIDQYQPPLVAILRGLTPAEAPAVGAALFAAGWRLLEVPLNRPRALDCIGILARMQAPGALVGGGTMCSVAEVDRVFEAGGRMMVAPHFDSAVVERARALGMLAIPGVATPTEAFAALGAGAHALKWFPAEGLGPAGLKSVKAVLPARARVWPVGGIGLDNLAEWVRGGADGFGVGGQLYQPGMPVPQLAARAQALAAAWRSIREQCVSPAGPQQEGRA